MKNLYNLTIAFILLSSLSIAQSNWSWKNAQSATGSGEDFGMHMEKCNGGGMIVAGNYFSTDFSLNAQLLPNSSSSDELFVAKFSDDSLSQLEWVITSEDNTGNGCMFENWIFDLKVDDAGNSYITGYFAYDVLKIGTQTITKSALSFADGFLIKIDKQGNVEWAKDITNHSFCYGYSIETDAHDNVYVAGYFDSQDVSIDGISSALSSNFAADNFIFKVDKDGNALKGKTIGNKNWVDGIALTTNATKDNIIATGYFFGDSLKVNAKKIYTLSNASYATNFSMLMDTNMACKKLLSIASAVPSSNMYYIPQVETKVNSNNEILQLISFLYVDSLVFHDNTSLFSSNGNIVLVKYDANLNLLSKNPLAKAEQQVAYASFDIDNQNNYYIAGRFSGDSITIQQNTYSKNFPDGSFEAIFDSNLNLQFAETQDNIIINDVVANGSSVYFSGSLLDTTSIGDISLNHQQLNDLFIAELHNYAVVTDIKSLDENIPTQLSTIIINGQFNSLGLSNELQQSKSFELYDISGKLLNKFNSLREVESFNFNHISSAYLYLSVIAEKSTEIIKIYNSK